MLTFDQVTKSFFDDSYAIRDASFQINPGELVLITGPSGSGKTTLMRLITKEYIPTSGEIIFEHQPISKIKTNNLHKYRRKIGVVFQDYRLVPEMNVWENIALALAILGKSESEIEERVTDLLTLIQMTDKAFLFPSQLSGGEAQRVSIARALAPAPNLIFADEPTGNLDQDTSTSITKLLKKINELGTTVLLATHDTSVLDFLHGERTISLEKGLIVKDSGEKDKSKKQKEADKEVKKQHVTSKEDVQQKDTNDDKSNKKLKTHHPEQAEDLMSDEDQPEPERKSKKHFSLSGLFGKKKSYPKENKKNSDKQKTKNLEKEKTKT